MKKFSATLLLGLFCSLAIFSLVSGQNDVKKNNLRGVNEKKMQKTLEDINVRKRVLKVRVCCPFYVLQYCGKSG